MTNKFKKRPRNHMILDFSKKNLQDPPTKHIRSCIIEVGSQLQSSFRKELYMKKILKQTIMSILLCLILGITAFAAEDDTTATVTITNLAGYGGILELYKGDETTPMLKQEIPLKATSFTIENLSQGNYRAIIRGGAAVYEELQFLIATTYNSETGCYETDDVELVAKYEEPGITKDADRKTAKVGDRIKYTLKVDLPVYVEEIENKLCVINDMPSEGLAIDMSTLAIYACNEDFQKIGEAINLDGVAKISVDLLEGMTIEITDYLAFVERVNGYSIVVEYEAVVTEYSGGLKSTDNSATLTWREGEDEDTEHIYTYRIQIFKKNEAGEALTGAVFTLSQDGSLLKFYLEKVDGYYVLYPDQTETDTSKFVTELHVDENGILPIKGLDLGVYTLREVKAPEGYFLSTEPITIVLKDGDNVHGPDGELDAGEVNVDKKNQIDVIVYNYETIFDVPVTGSGSFGLYVALGTICICLGLGLVLYGKKTRR